MFGFQRFLVTAQLFRQASFFRAQRKRLFRRTAGKSSKIYLSCIGSAASSHQASLPLAAGLLAALIAIAPGVSAQQLDAAMQADENEKAALVETIVALRESAMGRQFDNSYGGKLRAKIGDRSLEQLSAIASSGYDAALLEDAAAIAGEASQLLYSSLPPCRVIDTRLATILTNSVRAPFHIAGEAGFAAQGGNEGGCGVPLGEAKAVMVNVTTTEWSGGGHLNGWAWDSVGAPEPLTSIGNFGQVTGLPALANGISLPLCNTEKDTCLFDLFFQATGANSHLVVDVVGYFSELETAPDAMQVNGGTAYMWAQDDDPAINTVTVADSRFAYNSEGGAVTYKKTEPGRYLVTFPNWGIIGYSIVEAFAAPGVTCQNSGWGSGMVAVSCSDSTGAPVDARFTVLMLGN